VAPTRIVRATDRAALAQINDLIHDYFFNVADVVYDRHAGQVIVPFARPPLGQERLQIVSRYERRRLGQEHAHNPACPCVAL
jgi:hypothetical protein